MNKKIIFHDRIQLEKEFHDEAFSKGLRNRVQKYYAICESSRNHYTNLLKKYSPNKRVLEYGCGPGSSAFLLAKLGADVVGIDISEEAIKIARETAKRETLNVGLHVMNAEKLKFDNNSFDIICGSGILHHLNIEKAVTEIIRTLKPDGRAIFIEPLGHNPIINLYRKLTPHLRTPDEHPLTMDDLSLLKKQFDKTVLTYFHLTSLLAVPFRIFYFFNKIVNFMDTVDKNIFYLCPYLKKYAWNVVIYLYGPKKFY